MLGVVVGVLVERALTGGFWDGPGVDVVAVVVVVVNFGGGGGGRCSEDLPEGPLGAVGGGAFFGETGRSALVDSGMVATLRRAASACSTILRITRPSRSNVTRTGFKPMRRSFFPSKYAFLAAAIAETGAPPRNDLESL